MINIFYVPSSRYLRMLTLNIKINRVVKATINIMFLRGQDRSRLAMDGHFGKGSSFPSVLRPDYRLAVFSARFQGYDVCSWELTGAPKPLALCDALKADIIVLPLPAEKSGYLSGTELTM